ncbi:MAG: RluA family pseudouridine synthase [Myxococcaceae bacterium]
MATHDLPVEASHAGERLDLFVGHALGLSRARLKTLFDAGAVRVDGRIGKKGQTIQAGQRITVTVEESDPRPVPQPELPLSVLHVDDALVFVDKPAGAASHPLHPGERGTVANALVARYPECTDASEDPREGGLCHRLDTQTSGVLVAARERSVWLRMRDAFSSRDIDKRYWAVVSGPIADEGEIELPLRHHARHADRVEPAVDGVGAREALTVFRVLSRSGEYALVEARILTGVLHQVRAHLASIGAPLVGDVHYGGEARPGVERFLLHARSLALQHPVTGQRIQVEAPAPADFEAALRELGLDATRT